MDQELLTKIKEMLSEKELKSEDLKKLKDAEFHRIDTLYCLLLSILEGSFKNNFSRSRINFIVNDLNTGKYLSTEEKQTFIRTLGSIALRILPLQTGKEWSKEISWILEDIIPLLTEENIKKLKGIESQKIELLSKNIDEKICSHKLSISRCFEIIHRNMKVSGTESLDERTEIVKNEVLKISDFESKIKELETEKK